MDLIGWIISMDTIFTRNSAPSEPNCVEGTSAGYVRDYYDLVFILFGAARGRSSLNWLVGVVRLP